MAQIPEIVEHVGPKTIRVSADDPLVSHAHCDACTLAPGGRVLLNCEGNEVLEQIWEGLAFMRANREVFSALA